MTNMRYVVVLVRVMLMMGLVRVIFMVWSWSSGHGRPGQGDIVHGHFESGHGGSGHPLGDDYDGECGLW